MRKPCLFGPTVIERGRISVTKSRMLHSKGMIALKSKEPGSTILSERTLSESDAIGNS